LGLGIVIIALSSAANFFARQYVQDGILTRLQSSAVPDVSVLEFDFDAQTGKASAELGGNIQNVYSARLLSPDDLKDPKRLLTIRINDSVFQGLCVTQGDRCRCRMLDGDAVEERFRRFFRILISVTYTAALAAIFLIFKLSKKTISPLEKLTEYITTLKEESPFEFKNVSEDEIGILTGEIRKYFEKIEAFRIAERETTRKDAFVAIAAQVAHDIRSPLAALDSVLKDMPQLPEEKRTIVRSAVARIRDIANHLIEKNREAQASAKGLPQSAAATTVEPSSIELLSSLIDPLVTEKRLQFRSKIGIEIECRLDSSSYGLFASIQPVEFKRVLSNLVNNSVDALAEKGLVTVSLASQDDSILIKVQDNGKGILPEILAKLGQRGETHGKEGGSGLGLYHARTSVESWGGSLTIESEVGKGTTLTVSLPQADAPDWFVSKLELEPGGTIVVLDDDSSIHQIWQGRFDSLKVKERDIEVLHFSTPEELRGFLRQDAAKTKSALYLTDYELLGYKETGLSLVEELGLGERSILITSRFEEKNILSECRRLKVRMIPKGLAGFVPVSVREKQAQTETPRIPDATPSVVLLDDDALVRMNWTLAARNQGVSFAAFADPPKFFAALKDWPKEIEIYLDSRLGEGIKGEDIGKDLHGQGFKNLYLATGFDQKELPPLPWIKKIVGKEPPWL